MKASYLGLLPLLAIGLQAAAQGQQPKPKAQAGAAASGVFTGRSGKPMVKARLYLGQVVGDQTEKYARLRLPPSIPTATTDEQGRFQFKSFPPGEYTIVYQPAGRTVLAPTEMGIKSLMTEGRSIAPLLRGQEFGTTSPLAEQAWGDQYTLMKGHTFYLRGAGMQIWNATVRRGPQGPYLEMRKGVIWLQKIENGSEIKFSAWSY
ncbi:MAG: hypothetical protein KIT09_02100 [Bryobacteraceae bacterium]|nr:hypothetical protein [Bryobacteraceae bacterium]